VAAPVVAGAAALLREALHLHEALNDQAPSSALLKALLIHGAKDLGEPNEAQGWGQLDIASTLKLVQEDHKSAGFRQGALGKPGSIIANMALEIRPIMPEKKSFNLKVTLVYLDAPGSLIQSQLYLSYKTKAGQNEKNSWDKDHPNNVQQIVLTNVTPSKDVVVKDIVFKVIPRFLTKPTPFAVVWSVTELAA